ncbi:PstS family phosphate ABC transporter substrate-binding protein [Mesobacillus campisalis]|nr:substrate-binding domain-containing protein [Mesobacillus campisalis]
MKRSYYLLHLLVTPLLISFIGLFLPMILGNAGRFLLLAIYAASGLAAGIHYGKNSGGKTSFWRRYLPAYLPVLITAFMAAILMLVTKGFFGHDAWAIFVFVFFPFLPNSFFSALNSEFMFIFLAPFLYYTLFLIGFFLGERRHPAKVKLNKGIISLGLSVLLILLSVSWGVMWERSKTVLPSYGFAYGNGYSSVDLTPYYIDNKENILPKLSEKASLTIEQASEMPVLDGAEAAYPVYAAFANATYEDITNVNVTPDGFEIVSFTNTIYAFERLVSGEVDIFFGAQPSPEQQQLAKNAGKELVMTPIGKEAFVFFVNQKNPLSGLTADQIRSIYSGKLTNWNEAGGPDEKIRAFQRPANSGSQTVMEIFMGDTPLMEPLKEEIAGMGDIMEEVASYRNDKNSIGYSFRFFTTGMNPSEEIKLLEIDGVEPSPENIASGHYPLAVHLYAVTLKDNPKETVQPLLGWMQGPQGQKLVEETGYIPLIKSE